jgi:peptidoglycan/xylan/chitin deacetylase (PgdA/CDA1 family)
MIGRRRFFTVVSGAVLATAAPRISPGQGHRPFAWPHDERAAVSLTYDDGLDSQLEYAVPALDRHGWKATFFLTEENMEKQVDRWRAVAREGHEIGDHTLHHPCRLAGYSTRRFAREEIAPTERFLNDHFGVRRRTFAYPCGTIELGPGGQTAGERRYIDALRPVFTAARAADGDPNDPRLVGRQRYQLQAIAPTYDRDDPQLAIDYLRKALGWGRWAILIFHDVVPTRLGDGDTSVTSHDHILRWIAQAPLWCAPMGEVFSHLTGPPGFL